MRSMYINLVPIIHDDCNFSRPWAKETRSIR